MSDVCRNIPKSDDEFCLSCKYYVQCLRDWIAETNEVYENVEREQNQSE